MPLHQRPPSLCRRSRQKRKLGKTAWQRATGTADALGYIVSATMAGGMRLA